MSSGGITSWGSYVPRWRLKRSAIGLTLNAPAGRGTRAVASYDEDPTTMAVEAGLAAVGAAGLAPERLLFATPEPPYLDKTNACVIHAALGLADRAGAYDLCGSVRSGWAAFEAAEAFGRSEPTLAVTADLRTGLAGGPEERDSGDGAAAFVLGTTDVVAHVVGRASATAEFLDRWRLPTEQASHQWEERFGEQIYVPLVRAAVADALKAAGETMAAVDHLVVAGLHARAVGTLRKTLGAEAAGVAVDRSSQIGNLGAAQFGVALADVLEVATPGQLIAVVLAADGADVMVLRTTDALAAAQQARRAAAVPTVADQVDAGRDDLSYATFLTWRGQLRREPPRRPDPERPGAPATWRSDAWKHAFTGSRCLECGFLHLPPTRVCLRCKSVDQMEPARLATTPARVATYTIDRLAFSLSPPVIGVVVDFEGGGRFRCEMTDVDADAVAIGVPVRMAFRRVSTAETVHNYFWKAVPDRAHRTEAD